jgi:dCMP deaminase
MKRKFILAHMKVAEVYSELSSAKRLKVGAVIVKNDTIIGIGYNGMPSGWTNQCEDLTTPIEGEVSTLKTKPEVIHAESNAISKVARSTNSTEGSYMFVTHAPCLDCAKLIHQSGISRVYYKNVYRNDDGVKFLEKCGVKIMNIE